MGLVLEDTHGNQTVYMCCERGTQFESKKKSRLGNRKNLLVTDFQLGDRVDVFYEAMRKSIMKLRLTSAKQGPAQQLQAEAK